MMETGTLLDIIRLVVGTIILAYASYTDFTTSTRNFPNSLPKNTFIDDTEITFSSVLNPSAPPISQIRHLKTNSATPKHL